MLPLFGLPFPFPLPFSTSPQLFKVQLILLAVTTVIEPTKLVIVGYWRWGKDIDARKRYNDEWERGSERLIQELHDAMEITAGGRWPGLDRA